MASIVANLASPALLASTRTTLFKTLPKFPVVPVKGRRNGAAVVVKAVGESSESSSSLSIVKSVQDIWDNPEERWALAGLGFAAIAALWASSNFVSAVDKLPVLPSILELIGILYSSWFVYRYLLFKPDREEIFRIVNKSVSDILGQ
ncbi:protein CURVATURE THYLAKOID 1C, chloroplastic [Mercurialis annua]|uniref:protein CURVATURE THYLAKOID 1C, chloroplastic n=1 Tax=Mercurialis annua TaxID=3986 RepID=UPI0021610972|nr:protein CURVATURE THYLAKOID 1C, chloroplastic [Mercurialis annua]